MKKRYRIDIEYDGTDYAGWQRQKNDLSVQECLENALADLNKGDRVVLNGSGRTDAGVHAKNQVAHFDLDTKLEPETLRKALQAKTNRDINVFSCKVADDNFHARFDARRRTYHYYIATDKSVFTRQYAWLPDFNYDVDLLKQCAQALLGKHDFTRLCRQTTEVENKVCEIFDSSWKYEEKYLIYRIAGSRFLHSMVRMIVGTSMMVARGFGSAKDFADLVQNRNSDLRIFTAPARGLFLANVEYEDER